MDEKGNIRTMMTIPYVIEQTARGERSYDLYSRLMQDNIILLNHEINDDVAGIITAQLLFLESQDPEKDINLYINSPGGSVSAGLAIYDTMNYVHNDIVTIGCGMCASMGAVLLAAGKKGKRFVLPNTEVMIHQPLGGSQGQATEIEIAAKHILRTKERLAEILAEASSKDIDTVLTACDRDNWLSAREAVDFGLVDNIISERPR